MMGADRTGAASIQGASALPVYRRNQYAGGHPHREGAMLERRRRTIIIKFGHYAMGETRAAPTLPFTGPRRTCGAEINLSMYSRFTHKSRTGRGKIPASIRDEVYRRDELTCVYCRTKLPRMLLTIDHLVPLALGGLDEISNYVTCCSKCNNQKAASPLSVFSIKIKIQVEELPVHGDPIIDNTALPIEIRLLRKEIFDKIRRGELRASGASAQKKIEKAFRRDFWKTPDSRRCPIRSLFPYTSRANANHDT
jgi:5-methylcytosine-specific restriction endonuclease McrA